MGPTAEFGYVSRQPGAPALNNRRVLEQVPGSTRVHATTEMTLRRGMPGLLDRVQERALRRTYSAAMARLPEAARAAQTSRAK